MGSICRAAGALLWRERSTRLALSAALGVAAVITAVFGLAYAPAVGWDVTALCSR